MGIFKQKLLWIGIVAVMVVLAVFGAAMMGSVLGTKPKELPVALVVLDQPAPLPTGEALAIGKLIQEKLTSNSQLPITWEMIGTEEEARSGLDAHEFYGALVIPADLSTGLLSLATPAPQPATVKLIVNEGMNTQAATVVKQMLGQAMKAVSLEVSKQLIEQIGQQTGGQIPVGAAQALLTPIGLQEETVHPVGTNNASGNAPGLVTQIMWVGSLVTALVLFIVNQKTITGGARRWQVIASQTIAGLGITGLASGFLVWMASSWYGMELVHTMDTWMFLWLAAAAFFLLQSALLNWMGFPAMGILVLLMFFSMPVLNMAPEFLSQTTRDWLYSWTPLRFAASGMREVMYYGGLNSVSSNGTVLGGIVAVFLCLLLVSSVRRTKFRKSEAAGSAAPSTN